tara:strand:- start:285 stop:719 length:435 start_codon:yes stop_codon:yes gene_type:complete
VERIAVLEQKIDIYESLSKEMMDKLERAVLSIQENSNRVAIILERHEKRLEDSDKTDETMLSITKKLENDVANLERKFGELQRIVWTAAATLTAIVSLIQILPHIGLTLTQSEDVGMINKEIQPANGSNRLQVHQSTLLTPKQI